MSRSSVSGNCSNAISGGTSGEVRSHCGKPSVVKKAWTNDNPGRRFHGCGDSNWNSCNFFGWVDVEKPHGWQKAALLEARDLIREQHEELKKLRALVGEKGMEAMKNREVVSRVQKTEILHHLENENKKLKQELASSIERQKLVRQFVIISWIGIKLRFCARAIITKLSVKGMRDEPEQRRASLLCKYFGQGWCKKEHYCRIFGQKGYKWTKSSYFEKD